MGSVPLWDRATCGLATPDCCTAAGGEQRAQESTPFRTPLVWQNCGPSASSCARMSPPISGQSQSTSESQAGSLSSFLARQLHNRHLLQPWSMWAWHGPSVSCGDNELPCAAAAGDCSGKPSASVENLWILTGNEPWGAWLVHTETALTWSSAVNKHSPVSARQLSP